MVVFCISATLLCKVTEMQRGLYFLLLLTNVLLQKISNENKYDATLIKSLVSVLHS